MANLTISIPDSEESHIVAALKQELTVYLKPKDLDGLTDIQIIRRAVILWMKRVMMNYDQDQAALLARASVQETNIT